MDVDIKKVLDTVNDIPYDNCTCSQRIDLIVAVINAESRIKAAEVLAGAIRSHGRPTR
jgi:hypothetical protein